MKVKNIKHSKTMGDKWIKRIQTTGNSMILCRLCNEFGVLLLELPETFIFQGLLQFWCYGIVLQYGANGVFF